MEYDLGQVFDNSEMEQLIQTFLNEADEFIEEMEAGLLSLEDNPAESSVIDQVFRAAHSLKGSSMAVGLNSVGKFTHEVEALLLEVKENRLTVSPEVIGTLLKCNDHIRVMIESLKEDLSSTFDSAPLVKEIESLKKPTGQSQLGKAPASGFALFDDEDEEATASDDHQDQQQQTNKNQAPTQKRKGQEQIKVSQERIDKLVNYIGEMAILLTVINEQMEEYAGTSLETTVKQLSKISKDVQDVSVSLRMLPLKPVFQKLRRIVRDTTTKLGKQVNLEVIGEDVEVDKSILDLVGDPLVHIIRNAVDHGIEDPEERVKNGKPKEGNIILRACHESGRLVFYINDDGAGINEDKVKEKAIKLGIIKANSKISSAEIQHLIFHPGFSTKDSVSDISGRGVGMDVVNNNIKAMSGEIEIKSVRYEGSQFRITLPQTFSIIEGTVVQTGDEKFVIPLADIRESIQLNDYKVVKSSALGEVLTLRGEPLPVFRLEELFKIESLKDSLEQIALIVQTQEKTFAIIVDEIISRQQIVIKNLGSEVQSLKEFSGSTILGDGKPALIVELSNLIKRRKPIDLTAERISA